MKLKKKYNRDVNYEYLKEQYRNIFVIKKFIKLWFKEIILNYVW